MLAIRIASARATARTSAGSGLGLRPRPYHVQGRGPKTWGIVPLEG